MAKTLASIFLALVCLAWVAMVVGNYVYPFDPAFNKTEAYTKRVHFTHHFPFIVPYYVFLPSGYDGTRPYPAVLALHGGKKRSGVAALLATDLMQAEYPSIVVLPIAPLVSTWALPDTAAEKDRATALPLAMDILDVAREHYNIDDDRTYVVGYSMGGLGVFGAVRDYPDRFAAAISVAGGWNPNEADRFLDVPLWAFHGVDDPQIPVETSRNIMRSVRFRNADARYTEFNDVGHASNRPAFSSRETWRWLFSHSR